MALSFKYRPRGDVEKLATKKGASRDGYVLPDYRVYVPKKGENAVRILPPTWEGDPEPAGGFGMWIWVHFNVGPDNAAVLCLYKMKGERCPICDAQMAADKRGADKEAGQLKAKERCLMWLVDRKDERAGVMYYAPGWTWARDLAKVLRDRTTGTYRRPEDPEKGYDVFWDREDKNTPEGTFPDDGGFQMASKSTAVAEDYLSFAVEHSLPECLCWRTYDEVKALYEGAPAEEEATAAAVSTHRQPTDTDSELPNPPAEEEQGKPAEAAAAAPRRPLRPTSESVKTNGEAVTGASRAAALAERFRQRAKEAAGGR